MARIIISTDGAPQREIPLVKNRITIGRCTQNDVVIDHIAVSIKHAVIVMTSNDVFLEDLGSTNGTKVNGQPVRKHFLQHDDVIELTKYKIRYVVNETQTVDVARSALPSISAHKQSVDQDPGRRNPDSGLSVNTVAHGAAVIKVLNGASSGKVIALTRALTTIGRPGVQVAVVSNTTQGYHLTHVEGTIYPLVNGDSIGESIYFLTYGDVIEMSGTRIVFG